MFSSYDIIKEKQQKEERKEESEDKVMTTAMDIFMREIKMQRRMNMMDLRTICIKEDWCDEMDAYDYDHLLNMTYTSDMTDERLFVLTCMIQMKTDRYRTNIKESDHDFAYIFSQLCRICTYQLVE